MSLSIKEYWYDGSMLHYADGDVGDFNHEGFATGYYARRLLGLMGIDTDHEFYDLDELVGKVLREEEYDSLEHWLRENSPEDQYLARAAFGIEAVDHAMHEEGWIKINGTQWGVWFLRKEDFDNLRAAMHEVLDAEGYYDGGEEEREDVLDTEITVYVVKTGNRYSITFRDLEENNYAAMQIHVPADAPSNVAASLDRNNNLPCYGNNLGD